MFYSQLIFEKEKLGYQQVFSSTQGFAAEQELCWRPADVMFGHEKVLHTWWRGTASTGNRLGGWGSAALHRELGALPPALHQVSIGASLGKPPPSALGQRKRVSYRVEEMLTVLLVTVPALFITVIAWWKSGLI